MPDVFDRRIRRAAALQKEWPFAEELLRFYQEIYRLQGEVYRDLNAVPLPDAKPLVPHLQPFLDLVRQKGPRPLADLAGTIHLGPLLVKFSEGEALDDPTLEFFPKVIHQTIVMSYHVRSGTTPQPGEAPDRCPRCSSLPLVSVLREDKSAETVRRSLVCSLCSYEWDFARVLCPACREERPEKLPRLSAQEIPWMRVEACDSCRKYLKSVDLTQNWDAEPVVDELASTPLDVIAREHGYAKIAPNLAGI
jgi:FdhE protein